MPLLLEVEGPNILNVFYLAHCTDPVKYRFNNVREGGERRRSDIMAIRITKTKVLRVEVH